MLDLCSQIPLKAHPHTHVHAALLALFHLGSWRSRLPRPKILAVNVHLRSAQLVHKVLVIDESSLEIQHSGRHLGLGVQRAATLSDVLKLAMCVYTYMQARKNSGTYVATLVVGQVLPTVALADVQLLGRAGRDLEGRGLDGEVERPVGATGLAARNAMARHL